MAISRPMALVLLGLTSGPLLGTARAYVIPPEPLIDLGSGGGEEALTGGWTGRVSTWVNDRGPVTVVQMSLRQSGRGAESHDSLSCAVSELGNLTPEQVAGPQRDVRFELVRDAGVLRFAGRFQSGDGAGQWSFVPSAEYLAGMRTLGYGGIDTERAYALAVLDVSRRFAQDLAALGYRSMPLEELVASKVHGVDAPFIRALTALGYEHLSLARLVTFRIQGVSPEFIGQMRAVGYDRLGADDLVNLRVHGITPDFVRRVNAGARAPVPVARLVDLRIQGRQP